MRTAITVAETGATAAMVGTGAMVATAETPGMAGMAAGTAVTWRRVPEAMAAAAQQAGPPRQQTSALTGMATAPRPRLRHPRIPRGRATPAMWRPVTPPPTWASAL